MSVKKQYIITSLVTDDYISFKSECDCFAHDLHVIFEKDKYGFIGLTMEDQMYLDEDYEACFLKRIWKRFKVAWQILTKGYFEFDYQFGFKGSEHVEEFLKYMNDSYEEIKKK